MFCTKCGKEVQNGDRYCSSCGNTLFETFNENDSYIDENNDSKPHIELDDRTANILTILSLGLMYGVHMFLGVSDGIKSIFSMTGMVLLIAVRIKCPNNLFSKIVVRLFIAFWIFSVVFFVVVMITCRLVCGDIRGFY